METVVLVLMILVCFNFLLKQTFGKLLSVAVLALVCALFTGFTWEYAIEQSRTQIADWLANPTLMLDTSVVLSLEVVLQMAYCMLAAHVQTAGTLRRRTLWLYRVLRWFPSILIFPVLFSGLVALIFAFPGTDFKTLAWSMAAVVLVAVPLGSWLIRQALPEKELRLELLFLCNALIAILGIVATVNGRTAVAGTGEVDWSALLGLTAIVLLGTAVGMLVYRIKRKIIILNSSFLI